MHTYVHSVRVGGINKPHDLRVDLITHRCDTGYLNAVHTVVPTAEIAWGVEQDIAAAMYVLLTYIGSGGNDRIRRYSSMVRISIMCMQREINPSFNKGKRGAKLCHGGSAEKPDPSGLQQDRLECVGHLFDAAGVLAAAAAAGAAALSRRCVPFTAQTSTNSGCISHTR